jgi:eukaryotic-like serine/threonine-protein kinase
MSFPQIAGLEVQEAIGSGSVGSVFRAKGPGGRPWALKLLNSMSINRKGLEATLRIMQSMPAHKSVLPVLSFDLTHSPYYIASPLLGKAEGDVPGGQQAATIESLFSKLNPDQAWGYVYEISDALAHLHRYGVSHGNLTPGNVFLSPDKESLTRLADPGQGCVGGTHHLELRSHFLYLCPDQIEMPEGFFQGYGASWDVYSFGVIAYRLLTGQFPRGSTAWSKEMETQQAQAARGLNYGLNGDAILRAVRSQPGITWPSPANSDWDERRRRVVEGALSLDPNARWVDMRDVAREFEAIEADYLLEQANAATEHERVKQQSYIAKLTRRWVALAALLIGMGTYAGITQIGLFSAQSTIAKLHTNHATEVKQRNDRISTLTSERDTALTARKASDANLQRSQLMVDQMLTQLLQLPTGNNLEVAFSREQLTDAVEFLNNSLKSMEKDPAMGPERARAYGNLGVLHLKQRRTVEAQGFLDKARMELHTLLAREPNGPNAHVQHQWLGRYSLLLANIASARGDGPTAMKFLTEATENLEPGLLANTTNRAARMEAAKAWFELGVRHRLQADAAKAAEAMQKVSDALDEQKLGGPPTDEELFLLARADLERGLAARDAGQIDDAITKLIDAVEKMSLLVQGSAPRNQDLALVYAEAYTELADVISKNLTPKEAAEAYREAGKVLIELIRIEPDWVEAKYLMARNYGAQSGIARDEGRPSDAYSQKNNALEQIGEVVAADPNNPRYLFLQAKLKGELAEILSDLNKAKSGLPVAQDAIKIMEGVLQKDAAAPIAAERKDWEIQLAVLYGILGQLQQGAKLSTEAKNSFASAEKQWAKLAALDTANPAIQQGLEWARNRLQKLQ